MPSRTLRSPSLHALDSQCRSYREALFGLATLLLQLTSGCNAGGPAEHNAPTEQVAVASQPVVVNGGFEGGVLTPWAVTINSNRGIPTFPPTKLSDLGLAATNQCANGTILTGATCVNRSNVVSSATAGAPVPAGLVAADSLTFPYSGSFAGLVNNRGDNRNTNTVTQTATMEPVDVDATDGKIHLRFAAAPILQNPGHDNFEQPYFFLDITNSTTGVQLFQTFNFANQAGVNWHSSTAAATILYTDWQAFDVSLAPGSLNIGDSVKVTVVAAGCSRGGHWGEIYIDEFGTSFSRPNVNVTAPAYTAGNSDITYTVTVKNGGGFAATNTAVSFDAPVVADNRDPPRTLKTSLVSVSSPGITCVTTPATATTNDNVNCNIGTIGAGASYTFTVTIRVPTIPGTWTNPVFVNEGTYSVTSTQNPTPLGGNLVQTEVTTLPIVDLRATLTDNVNNVLWGQADTYSLVVTNNSAVAVNGVVIKDVQPTQFTGTTWTCTKSSGTACATASGSGAISSTENLAAGVSLTYTIHSTMSSGSGHAKVSYAASAVPPAATYKLLTPLSNYAQDVNDIDGSTVILTVNKAGTGQGTFVVYPGGYSCGSSCTGIAPTVANNTPVAITNTTSAGSAFTGWSGGGCTGTTNPCVTTISGNTTISASFEKLALVGTIAATSNANSTNVRPGDTVDYNLVLNVPSNFAWPVTLTNTLPTGLEFVSNAIPVTTGTVTCAGASCTTPTVSTGTTTSWSFGNVACTTAGGCKITLGLRARVSATATRGTQLTDAATATYLASQDLPKLTVIEPNLTLARTAIPNTGLTIGNASTVTVTLANGGAADAPVVGAVVTLLTPTNVTASNYQAGTCPSVTPVFGSGTAAFTFPNTSTTLAVGASCSFSYDLTVAATAPGNTALVVAAGSATTQSVSGTAPPAKLYTATDAGFSITTAPYANGEPCVGNTNCASNVCDADKLCGYAVSHGPCDATSGLVVCRSTACSVLGVCAPAGGCLVDADCTSAQFCNTVTQLCTTKLDNGTAIPTIAGHTPALAGVCSQTVATSVCTSAACDADNKCGYADGNGTCASTPAAVCRSGVCSASGVCGIAGGCLVDGDCTTAEYCSTPTHACVPKLTNGSAIPTVAGHVPAISSVCDSTVATIVCISAVCDTDNKCGYADGDGTCDSSTVAVCRSGLCAKSGVCGACAIDSDCAETQYCDTPTKTCAPKLANGEAIPTVAGHSPAVAGTCTQPAAAVVCASAACDTDDKCGFADGDGTCTSTNATACRSGVCSASGVCGVASGCLVDADCASTQYCNTPTKLCVVKLGNGVAVPTVQGHVPLLNGVCSDTAATITCASGVCDNLDNRCGYADGDGACTAATVAKCRSGVCSAAGVCGVLNGCLVDGDCAATQYCDTPTRACAPKLPNGTTIPSVAGHVPTVAGQCSSAAATTTCSSAVCDTADNKCGYADGDGTCTQLSAQTVCRSGICSTAGVCGPVGGCLVDGDCQPTQYCNTPARSCAPKVINGNVVPTVVGHVPELAGLCTDGAALATCLSSRCDPADHRCGLANGAGTCTTANGQTICRSGVCDALDGKCGYADGDGPCTNGDAATVCRSKACSASGNCLPIGGCLVDADCATTQFCNTETRACAPKLINGDAVPSISGHTPALTGVCSASVGAVLCLSGVCDTADNRCGYANGDGPCSAGTAATVCRSGQCGATGVCLVAGGCSIDAECEPAQFCNTETHACATKLPNGTAIPTIANHDPSVGGICTAAVATAMCASAVCDSGDNKCGLPDGKGPCSVASGPSVCRTGACTNGSVCGSTAGCTADTDCPTGQTCDASTRQCVTGTTITGCQSDTDCPSGQTCNTSTNQCVAATANTGCQSDADCSTNQSCNTLTHRCVGIPRHVGTSLEGGGLSCSVSPVQPRRAPWRMVMLFGVAGAITVLRRRRSA